MSTDRSISVTVGGLRAMDSALKQVAERSPDEIRNRLFTIARYVSGLVARRLPVLKGQAQMSILPRATARGASIAAGGSSAPYYQWLDFGGTVGRGHHLGGGGAIKREWLGKPVGEGRYLYPAISGEREATAEAVLDAVVEVARAAGFEVH